jgi:folate-binding protein YgfZ
MPGTTDQYLTIVSGAGWIDRSSRGRLRFEGSHVASFLQALLSNDVSRVSIGEGVYATYLTAQGRMLADLELYHRPDAWLAGVAPSVASKLTVRLDQAIFSEDVRVADVSDSTSEILLIGGNAAAKIGGALSIQSADLETLGELAQLDWHDGFITRVSESPLPTFRMIVPVGSRPLLVRKLTDAGIVEMTDPMVEALRIEAGRPRFGVDMTEETIPLEAGLLDRAISTTKGCYVGQEIIIRILHRGGGRVAKRLVKLVLDDATASLPAAGAPILKDGREVGHLTSVAFSPATGGPVALGYVHRDVADVGQQLTIGTADGSAATVTGQAG